MATAAWTPVQLSTLYGHTWAIKWSLTGADDVGAWYENPNAADKSVHFVGSFNGATVVLQGTNEPCTPNDTPTSGQTLTDPQGNAISKTSDALEAVSEATRGVRPKVSSGSVTAVDVYLFVRSVI